MVAPRPLSTSLCGGGKGVGVCLDWEVERWARRIEGQKLRT